MEEAIVKPVLWAVGTCYVSIYDILMSPWAFLPVARRLQ